MGERKKQRGFINQVVAINNKLFIITKVNALEGEIIPDGISRIAVRGFFSSMALSMYLLKAIAALRAKTIHSITNKKRRILNGVFVVFVA